MSSRQSSDRACPSPKKLAAGKKRLPRRGRVLVVSVTGTLAIAFLSILSCNRNREGRETEVGDASVRSAKHSPDDAVLLGVIAGLSSNQFDSLVADEIARVDPAKDGWETEAFSEAASTVLKELGHLVSRRGQLDPAQLAELAHPQFACTALRPDDLVTVFDDPSFKVMRGSEKQGAGRTDANFKNLASGRSDQQSLPSLASSSFQGFDGLARAIRGLGAPWKGEGPTHVKLKVVGVRLQPQTASTTVFYQARGGRMGQIATWECDWEHSGTGRSPRLTSIRVVDYEETQHQGKPTKLFSDRTGPVVGASHVYQKDLAHGIDYWRARVDQSLGIGMAGYTGLALGDVNGDGLEDLYICQPGGLPNRLLIQRPDGTVVDQAPQAGVDYLDLTRSALLVDLDNDGDQDLVLAMSSKAILLSNEGNDDAVKFVPKGVLRTSSQIFSMSAADYDQDGNLDVFACGYTDSLIVAGKQRAMGLPLPYHDANNGGRNTLWRNDRLQAGGWQFTDMTDSCGLSQNNNRFSLAGSWEDYDNDGDQDLYVANDFGRNNLYRNDGGRFVDVAASAGVEDVSTGMSVSWSDFNNDGWIDVYVSNMFSAAGNRITFQRQFKAGDGAQLALYQRHARGNTLFENAADGSFRDVSVTAAVTMGRWAWSSNFLDINNDGLDDLFVANGFMTAADTGDL